MFSSINGTTVLKTEPQCPPNEYDCLFATEIGPFRIWHLLLIVVPIVVVVAAVIFKFIPCQRWPAVTAKRRSHSSHMEELQLDPLGHLDYADTTESPAPASQQLTTAFVVPQNVPKVPVVQPMMDQVAITYEREGLVSPPRGGGRNVRMPPGQAMEYQDGMGHVLINERSVDDDLDQVGLVNSPTSSQVSKAKPSHQTAPASEVSYGNTEQEHFEGSLKSSFRKDTKKRHSYHFEKPHVSFRLDPEINKLQEDDDAVLSSTNPLFLHQTEMSTSKSMEEMMRASLPTYQRYGSYHGFPYIQPGGVSSSHNAGSVDQASKVSNASSKDSESVKQTYTQV